MCDSCGWEELVEQIDEMMDDEKWEFAQDTLEGIREWVVESEHCTEKQKDAVNNIEDSVVGRGG